MTIAAVLAFLRDFANQMYRLLTGQAAQITAVQTTVNQTAKQSLLTQVNAAVNQVLSNVALANSKNGQALAELLADAAVIASDLGTILSLLNSINQALGGSGGGFDVVWGSEPVDYPAITPLQKLTALFKMIAINMDAIVWQSVQSPYFGFVAGWTYGVYSNPYPGPSLDWLDASPGVSLQSALTSANAGSSWTQFLGTSDFWSWSTGPPNNMVWVCLVSEAQWAQWQAFNTPGRGSGAPIWPGISNVTLGSAVALADGLVVPGPLRGIIVTIATVSYPIGFYPFGAIKSYTKVGGVVFADDNGEYELAQPLGLEDNVICPKTMAQADSATFRVQSGVTGTVTPWL